MEVQRAVQTGDPFSQQTGIGFEMFLNFVVPKRVCHTLWKCSAQFCCAKIVDKFIQGKKAQGVKVAKRLHGRYYLEGVAKVQLLNQNYMLHARASREKAAPL